MHEEAKTQRGVKVSKEFFGIAKKIKDIDALTCHGLGIPVASSAFIAVMLPHVSATFEDFDCTHV